MGEDSWPLDQQIVYFGVTWISLPLTAGNIKPKSKWSKENI